MYRELPNGRPQKEMHRVLSFPGESFTKAASSPKAAARLPSAQAEQPEMRPGAQPKIRPGAQPEVLLESPPLAQLREDYLRERRVEGIRDTTLRMYNEALRLFETWGQSEGILFIHQIKTKHVQDYLLSQMSRKLSERTIRNRAIVLAGVHARDERSRGDSGRGP